MDQPVERPTSDLRIELSGSPFGIAWGFLYGCGNIPAAEYLPDLRRLHAGLTKIYLFWGQVEPERGVFDWRAVDAFAGQLEHPGEGLISVFSSSQWATQQPATLLPPSPAKDLDEYYHFIYELVRRCRGRVRYFQNDAEPNNPVYWNGSKEAFVAQLRVFYRAVKAADPQAVVVVGGYDGLFNPPGIPPFPNQQAGLDFFDFVLAEGAGAFDLFDLRLYNDPYLIPACVDFMRQKMRRLGYERPIICTEYGGPGFFSFEANRKYIPLVAAWAQSVAGSGGDSTDTQRHEVAGQIEALYANMPSLAPQTQMFMRGCPADLDARLSAIQACEIIDRNLLALSAGVQKTIYWDLVYSEGNRADLMDLMYGKIGMLEVRDGRLVNPRLNAQVFARMAMALEGVESVERVDIPDEPVVYAFKVERAGRSPLLVAWERRDAFAQDWELARPIELAWQGSVHRAEDVFGRQRMMRAIQGGLQVDISAAPVFVGGEDLYPERE